MEFGFDNIQDTQEALVDRMTSLESTLQGLATLASAAVPSQPDAPAPAPAPEIVMPEIPAPIIEDTQAPWWLLIVAVAGTAVVVGGLSYLAARKTSSQASET